MEALLIPVETTLDNPLVQQVKDFCEQAQHLEELLTFWVNKDQSIIIGSFKEKTQSSNGATQVGSAVQALTISFLRAEQTIATAKIPRKTLLKMFPALVPLSETVIASETKPGFKPDEYWFDQRNTRLGVVVDDELDINIAPPEAVLELVLSYALSSAGFAEVQQLSDTKIKNEYFIKLSLVFLGLVEEQGWYESIIVDRLKLGAYLKQRKNSYLH